MAHSSSNQIHIIFTYITPFCTSLLNFFPAFNLVSSGTGVIYKSSPPLFCTGRKSVHSISHGFIEDIVYFAVCPKHSTSLKKCRYPESLYIINWNLYVKPPACHGTIPCPKFLEKNLSFILQTVPRSILVDLNAKKRTYISYKMKFCNDSVRVQTSSLKRNP